TAQTPPKYRWPSPYPFRTMNEIHAQSKKGKEITEIQTNKTTSSDVKTEIHNIQSTLCLP
ncbi:MAG: hypothetical protein ACK53L_08400, partial [Pirellulaceae bacterium]